MAYVDDLAISGHAYYAGEHAAGLRACERLLASQCCAAIDEEKVRRNRVWYTPLLSAVVGPVSLRRIDVEPVLPGWTTFNPAIAADGDGLIGIVRSSNYRVTQRGEYLTPPEDGGVIKTRNILVRMSRDGEVVSADALIGPGYDTSDFPIKGMEDLRLASGYSAGEWFVSGTVCDVAGAAGERRIGVARLLPDCGILCDFCCYDPPIAGRCEKNWAPVAPGTWLYASWEDGDTVYAVDCGTGWDLRKARRRGDRGAPWIARGFRGGSQLVAWPGGGYVACVHEVAQLGPRRAYEHRLVRYDDSLAIVSVTNPFVFNRHQGIEFCAGAAVVGDSLLLSYGDDDSSAWIASVAIDGVNRAWRDT